LRLGCLVLLAGCFSPSFQNAKTPCATNDECPPGLHCAADQKCWKDGSDPIVDLSAVQPPEDGGEDGSVDAGGDLTPGIKHQGEPCSPADSCDTGLCIDGYCCDSLCGNTCQACNVPNFLGICSNVSFGGAPAGARSCNPQDASTCGRDGKCDGAGNCRNWPSGTECAAGSCEVASGNFTYPSTCNGTGSCVSNGGDNCAPYKCKDATQCYSMCSGSDNTPCSGVNTCTNGSCGKLPDGRGCSMGAECVHGNCIDSRCCDTTCTNACQACDVPGSFGMCTTVAAGTPHGTRSCAHQGMSPCGGSCNGSAATCTYAPNTTPCGSACTSATQLTNSFCDGAGNCAAASPQTCVNSFKCVGSACLSACNGDNDCASATYGCVQATKACVGFCSCDDSKLDECIAQ
jgi:hypothetical protein